MNVLELKPHFGMLRNTMFLKIIGTGEITYFEIFDSQSNRGVGTSIHTEIVEFSTKEERIKQLIILLGYLCVNAHAEFN